MGWERGLSSHGVSRGGFVDAEMMRPDLRDTLWSLNIRKDSMAVDGYLSCTVAVMSKW